MTTTQNPIDAFPAGRSVMLDAFRTEALDALSTAELEAKRAALGVFAVCPAGSVLDLQRRAVDAVLAARHA